MSLVLDTTVGGEFSNSYATLAEANTYFESRFTSGEGWSAFTDSQKTARLIQACRVIDRLFFIGTPTHLEYGDPDNSFYQALQWPRKSDLPQRRRQDYFIVGKLFISGKFLELDEIPSTLKYAQCELALIIYDADGNLNNASRLEDGTAIQAISLGDFRVQYSEQFRQDVQLISQEAFDFLAPLLCDGTIDTPRG